MKLKRKATGSSLVKKKDWIGPNTELVRGMSADTLLIPFKIPAVKVAGKVGPAAVSDSVVPTLVVSS